MEIREKKQGFVLTEYPLDGYNGYTSKGETVYE